MRMAGTYINGEIKRYLRGTEKQRCIHENAALFLCAGACGDDRVYSMPLLWIEITLPSLYYQIPFPSPRSITFIFSSISELLNSC